jgi:outer membrane scaffolding protein for murein synthesis (MipA/OmpV family)
MNKDISMRLRNIASVAIAAALVGPTKAMADGLLSNGEFSIGVGAFYSTSIYKGEKSETAAVPFLSYDSDRLHLGFDGIGFNVVNRDDLEFALRLAPGEKPDFPKNRPLFAGLKRGTPIEAGFDATYSFENFYVSGGAMFDVSSEHKGYQAEAKLGSEFAFGSAMVDVGAGVRTRDGKLNNFLYGVSAAEANGSRAAYDVGSTTEPFIDITVSYAVSDNVILLGVADYHLLDDKVHSSPLSNGKDSYSVGLGLIYSF